MLARVPVGVEKERKKRDEVKGGSERRVVVQQFRFRQFLESKSEQENKDHAALNLFLVSPEDS